MGNERMHLNTFFLIMEDWQEGGYKKNSICDSSKETSRKPSGLILETPEFRSQEFYIPDCFVASMITNIDHQSFKKRRFSL